MNLNDTSYVMNASLYVDFNFFSLMFMNSSKCKQVENGLFR